MIDIPDEVYEEFLWLLVKHNCPYALLLIAAQAQEAGLSARDFLKNIIEKELAKGGAIDQTETLRD